MADTRAHQDRQDQDQGASNDSDLDLDDDELFNDSNYREQRLEQLKRQYVYRQFLLFGP